MAKQSGVLRVLYFTIVDIGRTDNGGGLVCRNHATRIAETPHVSLTICNVGPARSGAAAQSLPARLVRTFAFSS